MRKVETVKASGSFLQGYMKASYLELVEVFGKPNLGPNDFGLDKVTCEWVLEYEDNKYCTIYDWKLPETPNYKYQWHIGGTEMECIEHVVNYFNSRKEI